MTELSHADLERLLEQHQRRGIGPTLMAIAVLCAWMGSCNLYDVGETKAHRIDPGVTVVMPVAGKVWREIAPDDAGDTRLPAEMDGGT